jgi:tetratricopeptide (TPR) repeat protein
VNRSERRRQEALQGRGAQRPDSFALRTLLEEGTRHHQAGRLSEAERSYRLALEMAPGHPDALHLLGLLAYRANRLDQAVELLTQAIDASPSNALYWFNLGVVTQRAGRREEAVRAYERAVALNPTHVEALINLGNVLKDIDRLDQAITAYRKALALNAHHADAHNNLGVALKEQDRLAEAVAAYREALRVKPSHLEAHNNLGLALMESHRVDDAVASFEQALAIQPSYGKALYNLGIASIWKGDDRRAVECFSQAAQAKHNHGKPVTEPAVYRSRLKHDIEQINYLMNRGLLGPEQMGYLQSLRQVESSLSGRYPDRNRCPIEPAQAASIAPSFNRFLHLAACDRIPTGALTPALDVAEVEARYLGRHPEVTYIDRLLNEEALAALRTFCWESTIWKKDYENGYLGAFLGDGFATPLLLQIAEELRLKFPRIFKQHRLTQAWAFKQDHARRGLNIHADAAAVNVNFWITPDEANLDPETGGLVVYDKEAPRDWNFAAYNSEQNKPKIMEWLKESGARAVRIPYRANRAVVFNSDLFHETDTIHFKDDYLSRRINITLLYGHRHQE